MRFTVQSVKHPIYVTPTGKHIHMIVKFAEFPEEFPFVAWEDDPEEHGRFLYNEAINGVYGPIVPFNQDNEVTDGTKPTAP